MDNRDLNKTEPNDEIVDISTAEELVDFAKNTGSEIDISAKEAQLLLDYMEGHGYVLGKKDGELVRGDTCEEPDGVVWSFYSLEDAIDVVCEWNYELILEAHANKEDISTNQKYVALKKDEAVLDHLFNQTEISRQIESVAEKLANDVIQILTSDRSKIDEAARNAVQEMRKIGASGRSR